MKKTSTKIRYDKKRQYVYDYLLAHPCVRCGEKDPVVLSFDHIRGKKFSVSFLVSRNRGWDIIEAEIKKCQILCHNCHARKTAKDRNWYKGLKK